jgi:hypothetical protein
MLGRMTGFLLMATIGFGGAATAPSVSSSPYPRGEDAAVFRAALDKIFEGGGEKFVVLLDSTVAWPMPAADVRARWRDREHALGRVFDPEMVESFIAANTVRAPIDPNFGYRVPIRLLSDSLRKVFEARGKILVDEARRNHSSGIDMMPFWTGFYDSYPNAHGYALLSKPGFNRNDTGAIVEFGQGCGSLCGESGYMVLEKRPAGWYVTEKVVEVVS